MAEGIRRLASRPDQAAEGPRAREYPAKEAGGRGYRQLQKGGESVINGLDPLYILKMMGKYSAKKEGLKEQVDFRKTLRRLKIK